MRNCMRLLLQLSSAAMLICEVVVLLSTYRQQFVCPRHLRALQRRLCDRLLQETPETP
jgi:hypothetical protein